MNALVKLPKSKALPSSLDHRNSLEIWPTSDGSVNKAAADPQQFVKSLKGKGRSVHLKFPKRPVVFISDAHADAEAFEASLGDAGVIQPKDPGLCGYTLTKWGKKAEIIIGGDCLDKGPSNLALLRSIKHLMRLGARVKLLAGNHDLRLLMGILALHNSQNIGSEHFFIRMGKKVIPLFREIFVNYLQDTNWSKHVPDEEECRERLYPREEWFEHFPLYAAGILTPEGIDREVRKMRSKVDSFEQHCAQQDLTLRQVYAAAEKCRQLFLTRKGEFGWFYRKMELVTQRGSFLFLHAGLDDAMCDLISRKGCKYANRAFHKNLSNTDLFHFYYTSLANTFRTKYRRADLPLTDRGVNRIQKAGIKVVVHGHVNQLQGQRLAVKRGLMHVEADITLDCHSRHKEELTGMGSGATIISRDIGILGVSSDYPNAKVFHPKLIKKMFKSAT